MRTVSLCLLLLATLPAGAQTPGAATAYRVEVIIFRANAVPSGEDLSLPAEGRGFGGVYTAAGPQPQVLEKIQPSAMQMNDIAARIARSGEWQLLAHAAWVQNASPWPRHAGVPLHDAGIDVPDLDGEFYVESGDLLHLGMNLHLGSAQPWSLAELRAVKFNEKHYFDHPGFGVIAMVTRAKGG